MIYPKAVVGEAPKADDGNASKTKGKKRDHTKKNVYSKAYHRELVRYLNLWRLGFHLDLLKGSINRYVFGLSNVVSVKLYMCERIRFF